MTMHIDAAVLADVMDLTGAASKTEAVEIALRELARRHRQRRILREGLGLNAAQWEVASQPAPSDAIDTPDTDHEAVKRALARPPARRAGEFNGYAAEGDASTDDIID